MDLSNGLVLLAGRRELRLGDKAVAGLSAYQIAVAQGYVGTEVQWNASLVVNRDLAIQAASDANRDSLLANADRIDAETASNGAQAAQAAVVAALAGTSLSNATLNAASRVILAALDKTLGLPAFLTEAGREGVFVPVTANLSAQVTGDPQQAIYVAFSSDATGAAGAWVRKFDGILRPGMFGAKLDDSAFDNGPALVALSNYLVANGGVAFGEKGTYWVGSQVANGPSPNGTMLRAPANARFLNIVNSTKNIHIDFRTSVMKCRAGLYYGGFNADMTPRAAPTYTPTEAATPYHEMIRVDGCSGTVHIYAGELDGNIAAQIIGGGYDFTGIQYPYSAVFVGENTGEVRVHGHGHHHGLDGVIVDAFGELTKVDNLDVSGRFNYNGRQGASLVGGVGFTLGKFGGFQAIGTGKDLGATMVYSAPGSGIDVEPEAGKWVGVDIFDPDISDSFVTGYVSPSEAPNVLYCRTHRGKIVGTTSWAIWPANPNISFHGTTVIGAIVNSYGPEPGLCTYWENCWIDDDEAKSPTGVVYNQNDLLFFGGGPYQRFKKTTFRMIANNGGSATWGAANWEYDACRFIETAGTNSLKMFGHYRGGCMFENTGAVPGGGVAPFPFNFNAGESEDYWYHKTGAGVVTAYPATVEAETRKKIFAFSSVYDPPSLALGAKGAIQTIVVTGAALGDLVDRVSFSNDLAGENIVAWVSATNAVSFYFSNDNGANPTDLLSGTVRGRVVKA